MDAIEEILKLSTAERILLVEKIWDSVSHENIDITKQQTEELERRLERFKSGNTKFYSWDEIKQTIN